MGHRIGWVVSWISRYLPLARSEFEGILYAIHNYIYLMAPPGVHLHSRLVMHNLANYFVYNLVSLFVIFTVPCLVSFVKFRHFLYSSA